MFSDQLFSFTIRSFYNSVIQSNNLNIKKMLRQEDETFQHLAREQQNIESSYQEHEVKKKGARDHSSNVLHSEIVKDSLYRKCIPLRERIGNWFYCTARCSNSEASYVEKLDELERKHPISLNEAYKKMMSDKIMKIKIVETSRLQLDSNVIHPFVKVHIVDKNTGCYIEKKHEQVQPMVYHQESITFYDPVERKYEASENNIILPFATTMSDFREMGDSLGRWNQKFYINYPAQKLMNADTLFLFELLDFNHQALLYKDTDIYDKNNFYKIAWGFLRPVGMGKVHIGVSKLELYRYKFNNKKEEGSINRSFIPSVYYDFIWTNKQKYDGFLTVQLNYVASPKYRFIDEDAECPQHLFEEEKLDPTFLKRLPGESNEEERHHEKKSENLLRFFRNKGICQVPKTLVYKLESEKLGCYRVLFVGNYLFAACSSTKHTSIKVFSLEKGEKVMTLKGHRQMIYSLNCTLNEKFLISAGSDHIARVWEIPNSYGEYIDEDESESHLRAQCVHTAAVYSTASIHIPLNDKLFMVTCCYDGYVRLWEVNLEKRTYILAKQILINNFERSPHKVYPTACVVSQSNFFIVGDSIGDVRIYDFARDTLNQRCHIIHEELRDDEIISIKILNKNNILIQASDNLIRHFELSTSKLRLVLKFTGAQFESNLSDCTVSPDLKYLLSPSETGKPFLWDLSTGSQISLDHLNLDIKGPLVTCAWHSLYNLVAFGGFVELCPVMVYGNILSEAEQKLVAAQIL